MTDNIKTLKKHVELSIRFNNRYALQYFEPPSYLRFQELLSIIRRNKDLDEEEHSTVSNFYKPFYLNYFKIKELENKEPRKIAQQFIGKKNIRKFIFNRDGNKCLKCGKTEKLQIDHIESISLGGQNKISNLQTLCGSCNSKKRETFKDYRNGAR